MKQEIGKKLTVAQKLLNELSAGRDTSAAQSAYFTELATQFQRLVSLSLDAKYGPDELFDVHPSLRIATAVTARSKMFCEEVARCGQEFSFLSSQQRPNPSGSHHSVLSELNEEQYYFEVRKQDEVEDLDDIPPAAS